MWYPSRLGPLAPARVVPSSNIYRKGHFKMDFFRWHDSWSLRGTTAMGAMGGPFHWTVHSWGTLASSSTAAASSISEIPQVIPMAGWQWQLGSLHGKFTIFSWLKGWRVFKSPTSLLSFAGTTVGYIDLWVLCWEEKNETWNDANNLLFKRPNAFNLEICWEPFW